LMKFQNTGSILLHFLNHKQHCRKTLTMW
jgi:hypothetical protein